MDLDLVALNALLEARQHDKRALQAFAVDKLWTTWLWGTDATIELKKECLLGGFHLIGLLIARLRAVLLEADRASIQTLLRCKQAYVIDTPIYRLTLRELRDTTTNLQLHWKILMATEDIAGVYRVVDACFHRFGVLALQPLASHELDDIELCEQFDGHNSIRKLNLSCIRIMTAFFFIAYRHLHLASRSVELCPDKPLMVPLELHLISASMDEFYSLSMYYDLNMGNVLQYRHEFSNMYHSISQVVYFNNTSYTRRRQLPLDDLRTCEQGMHVLPLFMLLYPSVTVYKEDETLPAHFKVPGSSCESEVEGRPSWVWFVLPGQIYLVSSEGHIFHARNMIPLFNMVVAHSDSPVDDTPAVHTEYEEAASSESSLCTFGSKMGMRT